MKCFPGYDCVTPGHVFMPEPSAIPELIVFVVAIALFAWFLKKKGKL